MIRNALAGGVIALAALALTPSGTAPADLHPVSSAIADAIAEGLDAESPMNPDACLTDGVVIICPDGSITPMP